MTSAHAWRHRIAAGWSRFWFGPLDPRPAALFRITLGTVLTLQYLALSDDWSRFYAADGIVAANDPALGMYPLHGWSLLTLTDGIVPVATYWWLGIAAAVAFTLGCWTRTSATLSFLIRTALVLRAPVLLSGEDVVARLLLLPSCFAGLGATWSIDAWRRRATVPPGWQAWPIRLVQLHVTLIYAFTQLAKLNGDGSWLAGDAMYYAMVNVMWSNWPWPALFYHRAVAATVTWGSFVIETAFPVLVWLPRTRVPIVGALAALHVAIAVALRGVEFFTLIMLCPLCLFLHGDDLTRWTARRGDPAAH